MNTQMTNGSDGLSNFEAGRDLKHELRERRIEHILSGETPVVPEADDREDELVEASPEGSVTLPDDETLAALEAEAGWGRGGILEMLTETRKERRLYGRL